MNRVNPKRKTMLSVTACARLGSVATKNSTRTCRPRSSEKAAAKEIATNWPSTTMSMAPNTGLRKSFAPITSMQVINITVRSPASPIHSNQPLNKRLNFSSLLNTLRNLTLLYSLSRTHLLCGIS